MQITSGLLAETKFLNSVALFRLFRPFALHCKITGWFPVLTRAYDNNGRCPGQKLVFGILQLSTGLVGFPVLTRAYDNNGRCPRQKLVFGILQLFSTGWNT